MVVDSGCTKQEWWLATTAHRAGSTHQSHSSSAGTTTEAHWVKKQTPKVIDIPDSQPDVASVDKPRARHLVSAVLMLHVYETVIQCIGAPFVQLYPSSLRIEHSSVSNPPPETSDKTSMLHLSSGPQAATPGCSGSIIIAAQEAVDAEKPSQTQSRQDERQTKIYPVHFHLRRNKSDCPTKLLVPR